MAKPTDNQDSTFNQNKIAYQQEFFEDDATVALSYELLISEEESSDISQLSSFPEYEPPLDALDNPFLDYSEIIDTSELDGNSLEQLRDKSDDPFALIPEYLTSNPISYRSGLVSKSSIISDDDDSYSPFTEPKFSATDKMFTGDDLENSNPNQIVAKPELNLNYMTTPPSLSLGKNNDNQFDLEAFIAAFDDENEANMTDKTLISDGEIHNDREVLNDLDEVDNLSDISVFEFVQDSSDELMGIPTESLDGSENVLNIDESLADERIYNDQELLTISAAQKVIPMDITSPEVTNKEANIGPEKNLFASFENASLNKKQLWIAGTVGVVSVIAVVIVSALG
ncbi:hypothetical protein PN476_03055, partial [Dolichospermum circinale CS-537/05]|nr:hypothetical protein [Dolichospermum circinale CS-537/05]